jgi:hypothetical protein
MHSLLCIKLTIDSSTVAIAFFRLHWLTPEPDITWWNVTPALWSLAEIVSGIACSCLPTYKPLLVSIKGWLPRLGKGDSTVHLQETTGISYTESTLVETQDRFVSEPKVPNSMWVYGTQTKITAHKDLEPGGRFMKFMQR